MLKVLFSNYGLQRFALTCAILGIDLIDLLHSFKTFYFFYPLTTFSQTSRSLII